MVLLGISVGGFACISSMASQVVPRAQTGEAQGVVTSLKALTEGLGPLLTASALPWFEGSSLPGAPWLLSATWVGLSLYLCLRLESAILGSAVVASRAAGDSKSLDGADVTSGEEAEASRLMVGGDVSEDGDGDSG